MRSTPPVPSAPGNRRSGVLADGQAGRDVRCAAQRCLKKAENRLRTAQGQ